MPQLLDHARDHRVDARDIAAIRLDRQALVAGGVRRGLLRRREVDVSGREGRAFLGQGKGDRPADPGAGPCHQCDFAIEHRHGSPPATLSLRGA
jgi:hypothetical protein